MGVKSLVFIACIAYITYRPNVIAMCSVRSFDRNVVFVSITFNSFVCYVLFATRSIFNSCTQIKCSPIFIQGILMKLVFRLLTTKLLTPIVIDLANGLTFTYLAMPNHSQSNLGRRPEEVPLDKVQCN